MKSNPRSRLLGFFLFLGSVSLLSVGCPGKNNPLAPATPTPKPGPIIVGVLAVNGLSQIIDVTVSDSMGNSGVANTGVTVFSNGVTIPLAPVTLALDNTAAVTFLGAPYITGEFFSNGAVTYTAGQAYDFQVVIGATTYSASITGISANPLLQPSNGAAAGVTCSWTNGVGNKSSVYIDSNSLNLRIGPVLSSNPYILSNSLFTDETPGAGNDNINLNISQLSTSAFPGAQASSCLITSNVATTIY
jgi:hypothetical protein